MKLKLQLRNCSCGQYEYGAITIHHFLCSETLSILWVNNSLLECRTLDKNSYWNYPAILHGKMFLRKRNFIAFGCICSPPSVQPAFTVVHHKSASHCFCGWWHNDRILNSCAAAKTFPAIMFHQSGF
ncbi:uncharacterized protein LOC124787743 isoform X1 [Schistocerca piceifrons]|uniref:uncharacterized protein LOC124787743 isoform X1 n=1 Tax=Schistocerca piceifrons TaxID=274613 RepID=UPI001F5F6684|nr:uncharacterized protein LOC124787743 isoform X1 [Schistocerca piceifrons]